MKLLGKFIFGGFIAAVNMHNIPLQTNIMEDVEILQTTSIVKGIVYGAFPCLSVPIVAYDMYQYSLMKHSTQNEYYMKQLLRHFIPGFSGGYRISVFTEDIHNYVVRVEKNIKLGCFNINYETLCSKE